MATGNGASTPDVLDNTRRLVAARSNQATVWWQRRDHPILTFVGVPGVRQICEMTSPGEGVGARGSLER